jgi:hypothetical protein
MLARFASSGLTQVEFCKREGLNPGKFSWWKREIGLRDDESTELKNSTDKQVTEGYWRKIIAKFNRSGLSKDDFCSKEGIKPAAFVWWRGELGRRDVAKITAVAKPVLTEPSMFVPVEMPKHPAFGAAHEELRVVAEVDLQSGTVRVFENVTTNSLTALFTALKEYLDDRQ